MSAKLKHQLLNLALLIATAWLGYSFTLYFDHGAAPKSTPITIETTPVPDFTFTALSGKTHKLTDFKGKTIILNFWATWCAPCVKEFPALLKIAQDNRDDVILIALSSDINEGDIKTFLKKQTIPGRNVFIALDKDDITYKTFTIKKLPETIIADKNLQQHKKLIGAEWTAPELQKIIDSLD